MTTPVNTVRLLAADREALDNEPERPNNLRQIGFGARSANLLSSTCQHFPKSPTHSKLTKRCKQELFKLQMRTEKLERLLPDSLQKDKKTRFAPIKLGEEGIEKVLRENSTISQVLKEWNFTTPDEAVLELSIQLGLNKILSTKAKNVGNLCLKCTSSSGRDRNLNTYPQEEIHMSGIEHVNSVLALVDRALYLDQKIKKECRVASDVQRSGNHIQESKKDEVQQLQEQNTNLMTKLDEHLTEMKQHKLDIVNQTAQIVKLSGDLTSAKDHITELRLEKDSHILEYNTAKEQAMLVQKTMQETIEARSREIADSKAIVQKLRAVAEASESSGMNARESLKQSQINIQKLQDRLSDLTQSLENSKNNEETARDEKFVAEMQEKILAMKNNYDKLKKQHIKDVTDRDDEIALLQKKLSDIYIQLEEVSMSKKNELSRRDSVIAGLYQQISDSTDAHATAHSETKISEKNAIEAEKKATEAMIKAQQQVELLKAECETLKHKVEKTKEASERAGILLGIAQKEEIQRLRIALSDAETTATENTKEIQMLVKSLKTAHTEREAQQNRIDNLIENTRKKDASGEYADTFEEVMQEEFHTMREAMQSKLDAAEEKFRDAEATQREMTKKLTEQHSAVICTSKMEIMRVRSMNDSLIEQVASLSKQLDEIK